MYFIGLIILWIKMGYILEGLLYLFMWNNLYMDRNNLYMDSC